MIAGLLGAKKSMGRRWQASHTSEKRRQGWQKEDKSHKMKNHATNQKRRMSIKVHLHQEGRQKGWRNKTARQKKLIIKRVGRFSAKMKVFHQSFSARTWLAQHFANQPAPHARPQPDPMSVANQLANFWAGAEDEDRSLSSNLCFVPFVFDKTIMSGFSFTACLLGTAVILCICTCSVSAAWQNAMVSDFCWNLSDLSACIFLTLCAFVFSSGAR